MPSGWQALAPEKFVSYDDVQGSVTVTEGDIAKVILSFRTPPGLIGFVTSFRQAWDTSIVPAFSLRINGAIVNPYNHIRVQIAANGQDTDLPVPIRVEQLSLVEVITDADSDGLGTTGNFAARVIAKYFNP